MNFVSLGINTCEIRLGGIVRAAIRRGLVPSATGWLTDHVLEGLLCEASKTSPSPRFMADYFSRNGKQFRGKGEHYSVLCH